MKGKRPLVSIIMNSHNGDQYLYKSINSILKQSYKNWELIFWDNCSFDKTKEKLGKIKDERIKYFYSKKFNTLYKSRNLAIKKAKGKYVCFLDVDDQWEKSKISEQVKKLEKKREFFIYSNYQINNKLKTKKKLRFKGRMPEGKISQKLLDNYFLGIITVMLKRSIFKKFKFDEKYDIIGDFDLFIRLSLKYKFLTVQKPLSTYNIHGENLSLKKINTYINELQNWIKDKEKMFPAHLSLKKLKLYLIKLKIKKLVKNFTTPILGM